MIKSQRFFARLWPGVFALAIALLLATSAAHARNVPGSASAVQSRIDQGVATSLLDMSVITARDAALFDLCQSHIKDADPDAAQRDPCEWGISLSGGARYIEDSPNGFDYDYTSGFGSLAIAHRLTSNVTIIAALITEGGSGDLDYNDGTLENIGVGGLAGAIFRLDDQFDFSILGGAEWLNYETTRSSGDFSGEYDAIRYMVDTKLRGTYDAATFFVEYGAGLRFIEQDNDSYQEHSDAGSSTSVPDSGFTLLTGIADLKLGTRMPGFVPYVQGTGYVNLINDIDYAADFDGLAPEDQDAFGRFGFGADVDVLAGTLSLTTGVFADGDGFQGVDGGFKFTKAF